MENVYKILVGNQTGRDHLKDLGADVKIIKQVLKRNRMRMWTGFIWLRIETSDRVL
jgi:hypothetical protein